MTYEYGRLDHDPRWPITSDRVGLRHRQDFNRKASPIDHSGEIPMLVRALRGDLSPYSPEGIANMRARLAWLTKGERH